MAILSFKFCHVKSTNAIVTRGKGGRAASKAATKPQSGRQSGILNYQTVKLLEVIESIKLFGGQMWERVARDYQAVSEEVVLRNWKDVEAKILRSL